MSRSHDRRRSPRAVAVALVAALGAVATIPPAGASAATDSWSCWLSSGYTCAAARHSLRSVSNHNPAGRSSGAAASWSTSSNQLHGSWSWGNGYACHSYGGGNVLYPLIANGSSAGSTFYGASTYGTGADTC